MRGWTKQHRFFTLPLFGKPGSPKQFLPSLGFNHEMLQLRLLLLLPALY